MSEVSSEDRVVAAGEVSPDFLLYDYFKHLTTISLVALGGVLSLSQAGVLIEKRRMIMVVVLVGAGGIFALTGLDSIVKNRFARRATSRWLKWLRASAILALGLGTGAFAAAFLNGVK